MVSKEDPKQIHFAPFLLLPSSFPRKEFEKGKEIQTLLNELMHKVAHDHEFLSETLKRYCPVLLPLWLIFYHENLN